MLEKSQLYFFFGFLVLMAILAFFIALPYLEPLVLAAALAVISYPLYRRLIRRIKYQGLAAGLVILVVAIALFVPFSLLGIQLVREATNLYGYVSTQGLQDLQANPTVARFLNHLSPQVLAQSQDILKGGLTWLIGSAGSVFNTTLILFLDTIICVFALFYFLRDGERLRGWIVKLSPLPDKYDNAILERLTSTIHSVVGGSLLIALLEGILAGIGFWIFGVPNAVLWGSLTAIVAFVPAVGTVTVYVPAIFFLLLTQHIPAGIGLWIWWLVIIVLVDNTLAPRLVNRGAKIHPFTIFIAVLGGISFFGPMGFLTGPLIFSLLFALLDIYASLQEKKAPR